MLGAEREGHVEKDATVSYFYLERGGILTFSLVVLLGYQTTPYNDFLTLRSYFGHLHGFLHFFHLVHLILSAKTLCLFTES